MARGEPFFHRQLKAFAGWLFTIYHDIRVEGAEHIPDQGAVIVAANHPTYLDPAFLMVGARRTIQFMAWEKPFRLPILGALMHRQNALQNLVSQSEELSAHSKHLKDASALLLRRRSVSVQLRC